MYRQPGPRRRLAVRDAVAEVLEEQRVILSEGSLAEGDERGLRRSQRLLKDPEISEGWPNPPGAK